MNAIITGAGGYIGRHVVSAFLDMGHDVCAVDIANNGIDPRAKVVVGSIFDSDFNFADVVSDTQDNVLVHMAWRDGFIHNSINHIGDLSDHFIFLNRAIEYGIKNICVMGTMHEIGYFEGAIDENSPCNPSSLYGIAKNALRQSVLQLTSGKDINLYWLRAYYILGDDIKNHSIFSKIIQSEQEGKELFPFTSGKNLYDFIDVDTLAKQIAMSATQKEITGIINVCSGKPVSLRDKVEEFIKKNNFKIRLDYGAFPDRPYDSPGVWGNADKINAIIKNYKEQSK